MPEASSNITRFPCAYFPTALSSHPVLELEWATEAGEHMTSLTVAVCGTGTMGKGIAQVCAGVGHSTRMFDAQPGRSEKAIVELRATLDTLVTKGKITEDARRMTLENLSGGASALETCRGADVVIEAIPENIELKVALFRDVRDVVAGGAIFATNTSSLSVTEIGTRIERPQATIGLHFFNPPPVMELVEIVRGLGTSDDTLVRAQAFVSGLRKTAIVVRDVPGFATSRLGVILGAEAMRMLETGVASAADIDRGMELGYRHPMGPLKLTDLVGLDVRLMILEHLHRELGEQFRPPAILRSMVRAGLLGKKTGEGFYLWKEGIAHAKP
jgi:3-hydroxybutyryl-CoA dehydrogenase